ncbi:MAG: hypothetical protein ACXW4H_06365 [Candidatus Limnocylindrales bacterium]
MSIDVPLARGRDVRSPILAALSDLTSRPGGPPSMLRQRIASRHLPGPDGPRAAGQSDRAMDVLQYGMAILAFAAVLILAAMH